MSTTARSSIKTQAFGPVGYVRISGVIDETFAPPSLDRFAPQLVLDVGGVQRISSFGVRRWIELVGTLPKGTETISIVHAPAPLVDQLGMIGGFSGRAGVLSVLAPYECAGCSVSRLALIDLTAPAVWAAIKSEAPIERRCPTCRQPMKLTESPTEYFSYFRSLKKKPSTHHHVEHFLRLLRMPDGSESPMPFKLLQDRMTWYQLRGRLTPNLNVRRMIGGLEGLVNFDFAHVSQVEPGTPEVLAALLEQSASLAEVIVSRVPAVVLRALKGTAPIKLASVLLPGECSLCGEVRPHCLPAHQLLEEGQRGPLAPRSCPVCAAPATLEAAGVVELAARHPQPSSAPPLQALEVKALVHLLGEALPSAVTQEPTSGQTADIQRLDVTDLAGADSLTGRVIGNYRLGRVLGSGSSACVYLGEHLITRMTVAVKILHQHLAADPDSVARFVKEGRITSGIVHEGVVQVLDVLTVDHTLFCIIMEHLDGQTMGQAFEGKIVPYDQAAPLLLQLCDALATAHRRGIVHRDLKPDNVYLVKRAGRTQVKLVDFGIARRGTPSEGENKTLVGTILGTPSYLSPEQAFSLTADSRADIYSLGVMMFELATGRLPFEQQSVRELLTAHRLELPPRPRTINPLLEPDYEEVILRTLAKDPNDRYQTIADLGRAIAQIGEDKRRTGAALTPPMGSKAALPVPPGLSLRRHPRLPIEVEVDVELPGPAGTETRIRERMTMLDISLSGVFVRSKKTIPEVFTHLVLHPMILGAHPLAGEVTRTTREEDPQTGVVVSGFGVHFILSDASGEQERTIQTILALTGEGAPRLPSIEAETEQFLARIEANAVDDYYGLLGLPPHANFPAIRNAAAQLARVLASPQLQGLEPGEQLRLSRARDRLALAEEVLVDPALRAAYDASRGNFIGIARCLASGLHTGAVARLREQFLSARPGQPQSVGPLREQLERTRAGGDLEAQLEDLTAALRLDPLALDLQTEYWDVWGKLKRETLS